jgi:hypothetical protein
VNVGKRDSHTAIIDNATRAKVNKGSFWLATITNELNEQKKLIGDTTRNKEYLFGK